MKHKVLYIALAVLVILACGSDQSTEAAQVGIALHDVSPIHGHSGPIDGGNLRISPFLHVYSGSGTAVSSAVWTKIPMTIVSKDTANAYNTTYSEFKPQVSGTYLIIGKVCGVGVTTLTNISAEYYIATCQGCSGNIIQGYGSKVQIALNITPNSTNCFSLAPAAVNLNGTTERIILKGMVIGTGTLTLAGELTAIRLSY